MIATSSEVPSRIDATWCDGRPSGKSFTGPSFFKADAVSYTHLIATALGGSLRTAGLAELRGRAYDAVTSST